MRDLKLWLISGASFLALSHAMPQPDPVPEPDVNVNVNVDVNAPNDDDINVDVNVNIDGDLLVDGDTNTTDGTDSSTPANIPYRPYCESCGKGGNVNRIVGGVEARPGKWPWQAWLLFIVDGGTTSCGGSIIKKGWILTAAHCFYGQTIHQMIISVGDHNVRNPNETDSKTYLYDQFDIQDYVFMHPNYDEKLTNNDIALIELFWDLVFDNHIQPVCLGLAEDIVINGTVVVTGWGLTDYFGESSDVLMEVSVEMIDWDRCVELYQNTPSKSTITVNHICALTPGKDSCSGDSGGPLVSQLADDRWVQIGIVSFGYQCAFHNAPGVYTKLANYQDWIDQTTRSNNCSSVALDYDDYLTHK